MDAAYATAREARQKLKTADHLLTQTYPLVKDPKLLLAVLDNIYLAVTGAMSAIIQYERDHKRIPPFHDSFETKLDLFKFKLAKSRGFSDEDVTLIHTLRSMKMMQERSTVEFPRKDKFVMCTEDYHMETISTEQLLKHIKQTNAFLQKVEAHLK